MLFSSNIFLFVFLPAVLLLYYLVPVRLRNPVLLIFSLFFYGWGEPVYLFLMIGDILLNYFCGLWIISDRSNGKSGKAGLITGVVLNLLLLGFFGGSVGGLLGMSAFRHKTKHAYFYVVNVIGLLWQAALGYYLLTNPILL